MVGLAPCCGRQCRMATPDLRRALLVDDEVSVTEVLEAYLARDGFEVAVAHNGIDALERARAFDPHVVILDVGLPGLDGLEVCRQLRSFSDCYVIMVTARAGEVETLVGLGVGADDYVTKPFSPREVMARVSAMLRRPRSGVLVAGDQDALAFGELMINLAAREAFVSGHRVELTRTEFDLLAALAQNPRRVLTRANLIEMVWGGEWFGDEQVVDVHLARLRTKLGDDARVQRFIRTVRGVGYAMVSPS